MASLAIRLLLSAALLAVLFAQMGDIDTDELPEWSAHTAVWGAAAFVGTLTAFGLAALRWQRVLIALGDHQPLRRLFGHLMAGQFVSNFVPTTVGGDVLRVRRLARDIGDGPISFTSVVFERLSGWLVLPAISFVGFAINPGLVHLGTATTVPLIVAAVTLSALVAVLVVLGHERVGRTLERRRRFASFGRAVHLGITRLRARPAQALEVIGAALLYQVVLILAAVCAAEAIGIDEAGPTALMAFMPAVLILQVLPLGIGGLGIRESALVVFLGGLDVPNEQALALGLAIYAMTLVASIIGFPMLILGGRPARGRTGVFPLDPLTELPTGGDDCSDSDATAGGQRARMHG